MTDERPLTGEEILAERIASFKLDPLGYVMFAFPWGEAGTELADVAGPRQWQRDLLDTIGTKLRAGHLKAHQVIQEAVVSGHGVGKSALVGMLVKWGLDTQVDAKIVITSNTDRQLKTKTSPELAKWHRLSITRHWFVQTATAIYSADPKHAQEWRADLIPWSEHNTEAFAGLHNKGKRIIVVYDEASAIADKVWEVTEGALTDEFTQIIWIAFGNGTRPTGRFRECFRKERHRWGHTHVDSRNVEGTNKTQLNAWVETHGEDSDFVKVRVRGLFPAAAAKQFISETDVDAAFGRHLRPEQYSFAPVILSVEPAWTGDDMLEIGLRQGLMFKILRTIPKNDNDLKVGSIVAALEDEHKADAVFVDGGYGTGIISYGRTIGRTWIIVWFSETPNDPGCFNKRAEMWKLARDWLKEGGAIPPDPQMKDDLIGPETVPRPDGKLLLEAKEDMKARGIPSPNKGDALALTFAHPVVKKHVSERMALAGAGRGSSAHDWDPLA